jgi:hypothetical protein
MTKKSKPEIDEEVTAPVESAEQTAERVFDFMQPNWVTMDGLTRNVYSRLRRLAILAGDKKELPDGKVYTEAQVIERLGEDYANAQIGPNCCG